MRLRAATLAALAILALAGCGGGSGASRRGPRPAARRRRGNPRLCAARAASHARSARGPEPRRPGRHASGLRAPDRAARGPLRPAGGTAGGPGAERPAVTGPHHLDGHPAHECPIPGRHAVQRRGGRRQLAALAEQCRGAQAAAAPFRRGCATTRRGSLPARPAGARSRQPPLLAEARDRLAVGARPAERAIRPLPAGRGRIRHGRVPARTPGPGAPRPLPLRRLVGEPARARALPRRCHLRARPTARPAPAAAEGGIRPGRRPTGTHGLRAADADPLLDTVGGPLTGIGLEGSVRGIDSATAVPVLSGVWLTRLTG